MSAKSIFEADGKAILNYHLTRSAVIKPTPLAPSSTHNPPPKLASLHFAENESVQGVLDQAESTYPWLLASGAKFVAKPDQLIKRRGKSGLLCLNKSWPEAKEWIAARAGKEQQVETVKGALRQFLIEPFVPHPQDTEYYININSVREVRSILPGTYLLPDSPMSYGILYMILKKKLRPLANLYRVIGFYSRTRVVLTLVTSMPKLRSSLSPSTSSTIPPTNKSQQRSSRRFPRASTMS